MSALRAVLLDTNVWSWTLLRSDKLSGAARAANDAADRRYLSPASFFEVNQKVRLGKWPEIAAFAQHLLAFAEVQGLQVANLDAEICAQAGAMTWPHRDPFDRMIAATALHYRVPIISSDPVFDGVVTRIW